MRRLATVRRRRHYLGGGERPSGRTSMRRFPALTAALVIIAGLLGDGVRAGDVELFRDDFARYPAGPLTAPIGKLNAAVQEYHYLPHRGVPLGPWANAICHLDAWAAGRENGKPYLEQLLSAGRDRLNPKLFAALFVTGEPEWADYAVEVSVQPL